MKARIKEIALNKYILEDIDTKEEIIASIRGNTNLSNVFFTDKALEVAEKFSQ